MVASVIINQKWSKKSYNEMYVEICAKFELYNLVENCIKIRDISKKSKSISMFFFYWKLR